MSDKKILFCHIGWMARYKGQEGKLDKIVGGGSDVTKNKHGNEVCNFLGCNDGRVYGHVESGSDSGSDSGKPDKKIKIEKIGAGNKDRAVNGVTVIWTAKDPDVGGRYVVGWYKNACVYRKRKEFEPPSKQHRRDKVDNYRIVAKAADATLVPIDQRVLRLEHGRGWMGQAQWWYPQDKAKEHKDVALFLNALDDLIRIGVGENDKKTTRLALKQERIGQERFRNKLWQEWKGCSVTGCKVRVLLRASHIKPWKESNNNERIDRHNGLLLIAGIDAAFDRGLVGFLDTGQMIISPQLSPEDTSSLGIPAKPRLKRNPTKSRQKFLKYHKDHIFKS